jgi:hypothetical protein
MDHYVVAAHRVAKPSRQRVQLLLQAVVLEGRDPAALVADRVMVVITAGHDRLIARRALAEFHALDEPHLMKEVERPVNAGDADVASPPPEPIRDLVRRETAALPGE